MLIWPALPRLSLSSVPDQIPWVHSCALLRKWILSRSWKSFRLAKVSLIEIHCIICNYFMRNFGIWISHFYTVYMSYYAGFKSGIDYWNHQLNNSKRLKLHLPTCEIWHQISQIGKRSLMGPSKRSRLCSVVRSAQTAHHLIL